MMKLKSFEAYNIKVSIWTGSLSDLIYEPTRNASLNIKVAKLLRMKHETKYTDRRLITDVSIEFWLSSCFKNDFWFIFPAEKATTTQIYFRSENKST